MDGIESSSPLTAEQIASLNNAVATDHAFEQASRSAGWATTIRSLVHEANDLRTRIVTAEEELAAVRRSANFLNDQVSTHRHTQERLDNLQRDYQNQRTFVDTLRDERSRYQDQLVQTKDEVTQIKDQLNTLRLAQANTPSLTPSPAPFAASQQSQVSSLSSSKLSPKHPAPDKYAGSDRKKLDIFTIQLIQKLRVNGDHFEHQEGDTEQNRMGYTLSRLEGDAAEQILPYADQSTGFIHLEGVNTMLKILRQSLGDIDPVRTALTKLYACRQTNRPLEAFVSEFQQLAATARADDRTKRELFAQSLSFELKDRLAGILDQPEDFASYLAMTMKLDLQMREAAKGNRSLRTSTVQATASNRATTTTQKPSVSTAPQPTVTVPPVARTTATGTHPGPMDLSLGVRRLTAAEKDRRRALGLCHYCGEPGHQAKVCPHSKNNQLQIHESTSRSLPMSPLSLLPSSPGTPSGVPLSYTSSVSSPSSSSPALNQGNE